MCVCVWHAYTSGLASYMYILFFGSLKSSKKGHLFIKMTPSLSELTSKSVLYGIQSREWFSLFNQVLPQQGAIETITLYFKYIAPHYNEVYQNECLAGASGSCPELFIFTYILRSLRSIWFPGLWFEWIFKIFLCEAALEFQASGSSRAKGSGNLCGFPDMDRPSH